MRVVRHRSALPAAAVLTVACFLGATAYSQSRLRTLDAISSTIATNALPSIEFLGRSAVRLQRLRRLIHDEVATGPSRVTVEVVATELDVLNRDVARYLRLTPLPGEGELWTAIQRDIDDASNAIRAIMRALDRGELESATDLLQTRADPAFERATRATLAAVDFDVRESERLAREVESVRRGTTENIILLNVLATMVAAISALFAFRAAREHEILLQHHNALLTERVTELDRFAGRAAHDILSPLNTVSLGLGLVARSTEAAMNPHIERAQRALQRVQQLVSALLQFARSGGQVESRARTRLDHVLMTVAADCQEAASSSGIDLVVDAEEGLEAACSIGVLTSLVQNLVSNAIKYMELQPVRTVSLRARATDGYARIEVEDTGPGIPADLHAQIFEPFRRGAHADGIEGLGLGLATVKGLAEAHGGAVGVRSTIGVGTLFWIDLPRPSEGATDGAN